MQHEKKQKKNKNILKLEMNKRVERGKKSEDQKCNK